MQLKGNVTPEAQGDAEWRVAERRLPWWRISGRWGASNVDGVERLGSRERSWSVKRTE